MKIFEMKKNKYILQCINCKGLLKIKFNKNIFFFTGECSNGHYFTDLPIDELRKFIKKTDICKSCDNPINFKCYNCNKEFNNKSINKENNNNFLININDDFYSNKNKIYLCQECALNIQIIEKSEIKMKIKEFNVKINKLYENIQILKEKIMERFRNVFTFFDNLQNLNEKLLMEFNYTIFDEYNYDNFNYFYNLQKNEDFFKEINFEEYILSKKILYFEPTIDNNILKYNTKINKLNNKREEYKNIPIKHYRFRHFKENIFFIFDYFEKTIQLFEYKNFEFKCIFLYNYEKINEHNEIVKTDYNHIFMYQKFNKNIRMLEYNDNNKSLNLKEDIFIKDLFYIENIIENKNGKIIILDNNNIYIISKISNKYEIIQKIRNYELIYNINDYFFLGYCLGSGLHIYETQNYSICKIIEIHYVRNIYQNKKKELLFLINASDFIYFINTKYFEIVQQIKYELDKKNFLTTNDINCYEIFFNEQNEQIKIKVYNIENGCFYDYGNFKVKKDFIIIFSNQYLYLISYDYNGIDNKMEVFSLNN